MKKDKPLPFPDLGIKTSDKLVISKSTQYILDNPQALTEGIPLLLLGDLSETNRPDQFKSDVSGHFFRMMTGVDQRPDTVSKYSLAAAASIPSGLWHEGSIGTISATVGLHKSRLARGGVIGARSRYSPYLSSELGEDVEKSFVRMLGKELDTKPFDMVSMFNQLITHAEMRHPPFCQNLIRFHIQGWRYSNHTRSLIRGRFLSNLRFPETMPKPPSKLFFGPARFDPAMVPIAYLSLTPTNKMIRHETHWPQSD